ncbi:MAG: (Fe-S)-binding protein [Dehalococcoidales bacterium]|nr:(Fe-S)-binding protein [Dehalococcoidales bacterium]
MPEEVTRQIYWNVEYARYLIYALFLVMLGVLGYGLYRRYLLWRLGLPDDRRDNAGARLLSAAGRVFSQRDVLRAPLPGSAHFLLFWGFILLTIGTALIFLQEDLLAPLAGIRFLHGTFYLWYSLVLDLAGLAAIVAVLMFAYRRYMAKPAGVQNRPEDAVILALLLVVLVGGFFVEGVRLAATAPAFAAWSPLGWALSGLLGGLDRSTLLAVHAVGWWSHMLVAFAFLASVGYSKLRHIFTAPLNLFFRSPLPAGALAPIENIEEAETWGASKMEEFTWKQLLDGDACLRCGRCQDSCPAWQSAKPLSPRKVVLDVRDEMGEAGPAVLAARAAGKGEEEPAAETPRAALIGGRIQEDELWACTTCRACQEHCPVGVEHIQKIVDMRRYLVLTESRFPSELNTPFRSLEMNGCPWELPAASRADWAEGLGVRTLAPGDQAEYLWWVGCAVAVDERNKKVAAALARVLQAGVVDFAILGSAEKCCGDPARRTGNEYLFQMLAQENVEKLQALGVRKILVHCPHCYNMLKNEYPQFGGQWEVVHSSELTADLLRQKRLLLGKGRGLSVTYHDPCYLGRHNGNYDLPRQILAEGAGRAVVEMPRHRAESFCCGGGGGRMWLEERLGRRINQVRLEEALATGAGAVAVSCPYCMSMLTNAVKEMDAEERLQVVDYTEVLAEALPRERPLGVVSP